MSQLYWCPNLLWPLVSSLAQPVSLPVVCSLKPFFGGAMTERKNWLLYGATGYTGELIARRAAGQGERPILAGRNAQAVAALAAQLDCPSRSFALDGSGDGSAAIAAALADVDTVLNGAGPFAQTAPALVAACLAARVNYLDITGEIEVIELAAGHDEQAQHVGVTLIPAVGFDVVPTDCLAAMLAERLPDADRLELAFAMEGRISRGTAKTMLAAVPGGGRGADRRADRESAERVEVAARRFCRPAALGDDDSLGRRIERVLHDRHQQHRGLHGRAAGDDRGPAIAPPAAQAVGLATAGPVGQPRD